MLNNIVDNIEQYGQHNIVQACFQQLIIFCPVAYAQYPPRRLMTKISILSVYMAL